MTVLLNEKNQEAKGQEGEGLRAHGPALDADEHANHRGPHTSANAIVRRADTQDECVARANKQRMDQDHEWHSTPCHELRQCHLHEPCLVDPGIAHLGIRKEVNDGDGTVLENQLACAHMPPEIVGCDAAEAETCKKPPRHKPQPKVAYGEPMPLVITVTVTRVTCGGLEHKDRRFRGCARDRNTTLREGLGTMNCILPDPTCLARTQSVLFGGRQAEIFSRGAAEKKAETEALFLSLCAPKGLPAALREISPFSRQ
jgi:hypothetical protein